ncbi:MAG: potassium-transporting ATPase subunit F [Brevundimonas sp.]|nr:MAG: potassium-transporting ATPase subunit F [Brevundimonas sp.]
MRIAGQSRNAAVKARRRPYVFLMRRPETRMARLRGSVSICRLQQVGGDRHGRCDVSGDRRRGLPSLRRARRFSEAGVTMLVSILWGVGAVVVAVYMVAALLRPERF